MKRLNNIKDLIVKALEQFLKSDLDIELLKTGCQGLCRKGPVMKVDPYGYFYQKVSPESAHKGRGGYFCMR